MDEGLWLESTEPAELLEFVQAKATERRLRLFTAACCRALWIWMKDERSRSAVEVAERFADGLSTEEELAAARQAAREAADCVTRQMTLHRQKVQEALAIGGSEEEVPFDYPAWHAAHTSTNAALCATEPDATKGAQKVLSYVDVPPGDRRLVRRRQARVVRAIFGNPFRPLAIEPTWRTPEVVSLARAAYEEWGEGDGRLDNDRLSVLADALEEAGATDPLLGHLRAPGIHPRGYFSLDAILGRR